MAEVSTRPTPVRVVCTTCGGRYAVNRDGSLRSHRWQPSGDLRAYVDCPGKPGAVVPAQSRSGLVVPEKSWQSVVTDYADLRRWWWYHTWNAKRSRPGFPDLVFIRERVVFAELKKEGEDLTPAQADCRDRLLAAGAEWYLWYPSNLDKVLRVLR